MLAPIPAPWKNAVAAVPRATAVSSAEGAAFLLRSGTRTGSGGSISKSGRTGASERANERELWHGRRLRVEAIEERARAAGKKVNWRERGGRRKGKRKKTQNNSLLLLLLFLHSSSSSSSSSSSFFFSCPSPGLPPQVLLGAHHVHHRPLRPVVHPRELGLPPRGRELLEASREREVRGRARCSLSCCRRRRRRRLGRCRCLAEALPGAAADVLADVVVGEVGAWGERGGVRLRGQARVYW